MVQLCWLEHFEDKSRTKEAFPSSFYSYCSCTRLCISETSGETERWLFFDVSLAFFLILEELVTQQKIIEPIQKKCTSLVIYQTCWGQCQVIVVEQSGCNTFCEWEGCRGEFWVCNFLKTVGWMAAKEHNAHITHATRLSSSCVCMTWDLVKCSGALWAVYKASCSGSVWGAPLCKAMA